MNKKYIFIIYLLVISVASFVVGIYISENTKNNNQNKVSAEEVKIETKKEISSKNETTLFFVGDIMLTRGVESSIKNNFNGDFNKLFENLVEFKNADILFGNLEGPVSINGNNVGSKYSFRMNPIVLTALNNIGFDIVSFANNHVGDWNVTAFKETLSNLENIGIKKTGAGMDKINTEDPTIIEKNGVRFGFIGFSDVGPMWMEAKENKPGILLASDPRIKEIIKNAKDKTDVLIVSFHFGEEYKTTHNKRQGELAHLAIDSGADMVIGHHPHVIQDTETYNGKPIVYSLGNFIFDQKFSKDTMRGMLFIVKFEKDVLKNTEIKIITLNKNFQPEGIFTQEEIREKDELISSVCPKPTKDYSDMWLLNIGQETSLPDTTYIPKDLREIESSSSTKNGICLTKEARDNFEKMTEDARKDGYTIKASSGFRSFGTQKYIFDTAVINGKTDTNISIAKAGYSEHQLGTAIDLTGKSINYSSANGSFFNTVESNWLIENAHKYGFILSYPLGKEDITGYKFEPWHYRFVGIENAEKIKDNEQTITEFLKSN